MQRMRILALVSSLLVGLSAGPVTAPRTEPTEPVRWVERAVPVAAAETVHVASVGHMLAVSEAPANPLPVVFITGPVGSAYSVRRVVAELLPKGHDVLVIDPLGMGASSRPPVADYSLSGQARRVYAALDSLLPKSTPVVLVAQGTSATVALHLAAIDTARIQGVLSLAGGVIDRQGTPGVRLALTLAPLLDNPLGRAIGRRRFAAGAREQSASPQWVTSEAVSAYLAPLERDLRGTLRTLKAMQDAPERTPIASRLPLVVAPVRLLVGDKTLPNAPTALQIEAMHRGLRAFTVDTLRPAGTMLHEEQAPKVAHIIDQMVQAARNRRRPLP